MAMTHEDFTRCRVAIKARMEWIAGDEETVLLMTETEYVPTWGEQYTLPVVREYFQTLEAIRELEWSE